MLTDQIVNSDVVAESQFVDSRAKSLRYVNVDGKVVTTKGWILTRTVISMFSQMEHFALGYI